MAFIKTIELGGTSPFYSTFWTSAAQSAIPAATCDVKILLYDDHWHMFGQFVTDMTNVLPMNTNIADFEPIGLDIRQECIFESAGSNNTEVINDTVMSWLLLGYSQSDNFLYCQGAYNLADNSRGAVPVNHKYWINYLYPFNA